jgi:flavodoxin
LPANLTERKARARQKGDVRFRYSIGAVAMKTLVAYTSRTGTTRKVAAELARILHADLEEIHCEKSYRGLFGYLRAGRDSWRGNLPEITPSKRAPDDYDFVILAGPLWAGHASPVLRRYVQEHKGQFKRTGFVLTHGGSSPKAAFAELETLAGLKPTSVMAVRQATVDRNDYELAVADFAGPLRFKEEAVF